LIHLKDVLALGKDRSPQDGYYIRKHLREHDEYLDLDISDHCAYFKTTDGRVIFTSQPYGELENITARVKNWEAKHGLKAEVFGPEYSWYNEHSNLVVISLPDAVIMRSFGMRGDGEIAGQFAGDAAYRALYYASRQLELCGWCPKALNNKLHPYFETCWLARKDGVRGCHSCMAERFLKEAQI